MARLKITSLRLQPETLVALDIFVANKNVKEANTDVSKYLRNLIEDHVKSNDFREVVKNFKEAYPEKYRAIIEKYAKGV